MLYVQLINFQDPINKSYFDIYHTLKSNIYVEDLRISGPSQLLDPLCHFWKLEELLLK